MSSDRLDTALHTTLVSHAKLAGGFAASEITGYSPEQVRRAAEALVASGRLHRLKASSRRVRYFADAKGAQAFLAGQPAKAPPRTAASPRFKAQWASDEPGLITKDTKITIAPSPPGSVFRSNTYLQF
jgi:hypothetical protein